MADAFVAVQQAGNEDDVILLGDLNVDEHHFGRLGQHTRCTVATVRERTVDGTRSEISGRPFCAQAAISDELPTRSRGAGSH